MSKRLEIIQIKDDICCKELSIWLLLYQVSIGFYKWLMMISLPAHLFCFNHLWTTKVQVFSYDRKDKEVKTVTIICTCSH